MVTYTTRDVMRLSGATYRQIDHWCRRGFLGERLTASTGSGYERTFTYLEVRQVVLGRELIALGVNPEKALAYAAQMLAEDGRLALRSGSMTVLITSGHSAEWKEDQ